MTAAQNRIHKRAVLWILLRHGIGRGSRHEQEEHQQHHHHRPQELALQRQPLAAQNVLHRQRRREQQLQRALLAVFGQLAPRLQGEPDFDEQVQEQPGQDVGALVEPVATRPGQAPDPAARHQPQHRPDISRPQPRPRRQPEIGAPVQQALGETRRARPDCHSSTSASARASAAVAPQPAAPATSVAQSRSPAPGKSSPAHE